MKLRTERKPLAFRRFTQYAPLLFNVLAISSHKCLFQNGMSREYPHKQRIRNLRKLIADGKVKPTSETLIFFLCNKFTVSDERQTKMKAK